jgi:PAS domain S-box-containing protein
VGAERMLGFTAGEVLNKITPAEISDPREVIARAKALSQELKTTIAPGFEALVFKASRGIEDIYELTYIRKDGSRFPAVVSVTALRDAENIIIGYLLIGTDNTARKQVEAEQKKLDQRLRDQQFYTRSLIESNIDALITTDPSGIITDVNKQMEALTGSTRDELIGAPFKGYFTDPDRAEAGIKLVFDQTYDLLSYATAAVVTSGTATLETALFRVPQIVVYRTSSVSYQIAKRLIRVPFISLPNLIAGKEVVKELIQEQLTENNLAKELKKILYDADKQLKMKEDYVALKNLLSQGGNASANAASSIYVFLNS